MKARGHLPSRAFMLSAGAILLLIVGHGLILYYALSRTALSVTVVLAVIVLVVIKHLGLLGPLYALFRLRSRSNTR
jgi:membrane protein YdbS with pleckstrin-like domain